MERADQPLPAVDPALPPLAAEDAIASLYRRYAGWLRVRLRRRFGPALGHLAEDLVQETYLRAARVQGPIRHPQALLMRIACRLAYDQARVRHAEDAAQAAQVVAEASRQASAPADQAEALLLKQIILSLPEAYRDVFLLSRFGGLSHAEIAARCGLTIKSVEWRMSRALAHCAARLRA